MKNRKNKLLKMIEFGTKFDHIGSLTITIFPELIDCTNFWIYNNTNKRAAQIY